MKIKGNIVDIQAQKIFFGELEIVDEYITAINIIGEEKEDASFIIPGFVDAHVHIESSMLVPSEFARLAVVHGTVATVSDPHEIANVCGLNGVDFMIENGNTVPFKFYFGAPSCVPATNFETAGAIIDSKSIDDLLRRKEILYLSEMMNFPGVLNGDKEVMEKISSAKKYNKPVDGHSPGLRGESAQKYIDAGISTDHECFTAEEALDKLQYGMKIIIREGSAAKNFDALIHLLNDYPDQIMFCSDDKHPDSLVNGHINELCKRAAEKGIDVFKILKAASINPVNHYKLKVGLLRQNDFADFVVVRDLKTFDVLQTYINGKLVAQNGKTLMESKPGKINPVNNFNCSKKHSSDFEIKWNEEKEITVIEALDGQLITNKIQHKLTVQNGFMISDTENDILKIVVVNRYKNAPISKAFIKNFGLKKGAIASSVAHDSHNIVAVGADDESICNAVNAVISNKGGISVWTTHPDLPSGKATNSQPLLKQDSNNNKTWLQSGALEQGEASPPEGFGEALPLPVAGLMSTEDGYIVAQNYAAIDKAAKELGSTLSAPFMTLSFMALLVIPHLKLSDLGLFDGDTFHFVNND